jgi:hypothetical protein
MHKAKKDGCPPKEACGHQGCPMRCLLPVLAVFIVSSVFEGLFHGVFMMPYYHATADLWRPPTDMQTHFGVSLVRQIGTALIFTCLFFWLTQNMDMATKCPIKVGAKFGFKFGLAIGLCMFGAYAWLPLPDMTIPLLWLVGYTVLGVLMGVTAGACLKMKKNKDFDKTDAA